MGLEEIQGDLHRYYDRLTSGICLIGMEPGEPILFVNKGMLKIYHCTDEADFYRFTGKRRRRFSKRMKAGLLSYRPYGRLGPDWFCDFPVPHA